MVKTIPTKRGTGISIYGLAHDLKYVYDVVHYIATTLDEGDVQLKGRHQLLMNFAYEIRKAYQEARLKKTFIQQNGEEVEYLGFNIVWTDILIFLNVLRDQATYLPTNKRQQSVLYSLESSVEEAFRAYDLESADGILSFIEHRFFVRSQYCFILYQAVHIEFVGQAGGKRRFKKLPLLLSSYFSEFHEVHIDIINRLESTAKQQNCDPTELGYSEFPEIRW
ncbi:MAG TPA: hypothetical protein PLL28_14380 [Chitinophagales bacterium]|nr:hypothetical protein [Chitinophagales bacterium]HNK97823.1 hypothetical protein [Chitinophagales bacterium]HNM30252.1 hypothetical protein [Chitinophagales bacterium]